MLYSLCILHCVQGCALAEPGGPWRLTFALGRLENLRFFIQIICWAPWILQFQRTGLPSIFLRAQPWCCFELAAISCFWSEVIRLTHLIGCVIGKIIISISIPFYFSPVCESAWPTFVFFDCRPYVVLKYNNQLQPFSAMFWNTTQGFHQEF